MTHPFGTPRWFYLIHYLGPLLLWSWMTHQLAGVPRWPILLWRLPQVFLDEQSFYECYAYLTVSTVQYSWMTHSITKVTLSIPRWPFLLFRLTQVFLDDQPYYEGYLKYSIPVPPILLFRPPLVLLYDPAYCEKVYRAVGAQPIRPGFQSLGNRLFTKQNLKIEEKVLKREGGNVTMYIALQYLFLPPSSWGCRNLYISSLSNHQSFQHFNIFSSLLKIQQFAKPFEILYAVSIVVPSFSSLPNLLRYCTLWIL